MKDYTRESFKKEFGQLVVNYRRIHNLTRAQLAELMNISDNGLARIETGDNEAKFYNALKLTHLLKINNHTVNDLFLKYASKEIEEQKAASKIKLEPPVKQQMNAKTYRITEETLAIKPNFDANVYGNLKVSHHSN
ncbi:helix-turn-helix domain-containing protein [Saliterribacillus persicus]|uniref:Helix-turn-helix protein n=1 Tax=Saliterribacillus persicus TaxID=930114 RepID=A0A368YDU3_9BACI|nr:helix-turn-helix transcriptional regulator [Saliterribacillus persicus]RCW77057.1 helix-turn-helix protein [Saliterribacillus persicus]